MSHTARIIIVVALLAAVGTTVAFKVRSSTGPEATPSSAANPPAAPATPQQALPQLMDLGANKCIPCKAMAPILERLKQDFDGQFGVTFIDVWQDRATGEALGIRLIPTQIFFDAQDKELFRHEGFYSREEILAKWKELGYEFGTRPGAGAGS